MCASRGVADGSNTLLASFFKQSKSRDAAAENKIEAVRPHDGATVPVAFCGAARRTMLDVLSMANTASANQQNGPVVVDTPSRSAWGVSRNAPAPSSAISRSLTHLLPGHRPIEETTHAGEQVSISDFDDDDDVPLNAETAVEECGNGSPTGYPSQSIRHTDGNEEESIRSSSKFKSTARPVSEVAPAPAKQHTLLQVLQSIKRPGKTETRNSTTGRNSARGMDSILEDMKTHRDSLLANEDSDGEDQRRSLSDLGKPWEVTGSGTAEPWKSSEIRHLLQSSARVSAQSISSSAASSNVFSKQRQLLRQFMVNPTATRVEDYVLTEYTSWEVDWSGIDASWFSAASGGYQQQIDLSGSGLAMRFEIQSVEECFSVLRLTGYVVSVAADVLNGREDQWPSPSKTDEVTVFLPSSLSSSCAAFQGGIAPRRHIFLAEPFFAFPALSIIISSYNVTTEEALQKGMIEYHRRESSTSLNATPARKALGTVPGTVGTPTTRPSTFTVFDDMTPAPLRSCFTDPAAGSAAEGPLGPEGPRRPLEAQEEEFFRGPGPEWEVSIDVLEELRRLMEDADLPRQSDGVCSADD